MALSSATGIRFASSQIHGLTANDKESAFEAATAGVDMEMHGDAYSKHLAELVEDRANQR